MTDVAFVLDRAENPHPAMLAKALRYRDEARRAHAGWPVDRWEGYREAMCDATGETAQAIEAWMDRNR